MDQGVPTYYLKWPQETKQAFLRLLGKLAEMKLIAFLRKANGRVVLKVAAGVSRRQAAREIGCALANPFMTLSFLPLAVIPKLRITDRGLVDVEKFDIVPLYAD